MNEKGLYKTQSMSSLSTGETLREHSSNSRTSELSFFKMCIGEICALIDEFHPSNKLTNAKMWIQSIEGLKNVYVWDDRSTLLYATLRLGGAASYWYQSRRDSIRNFTEFKQELVESFPSGQDDASILIQIMERKRLPGEPIEDYLYQIAALGKKINLNESSIIRYIISGLADQNLINVLTASSCTRISDLLVQIKNFEEIQKQGQSRRSFGDTRYETSSSRLKVLKHFDNRMRPLKNDIRETRRNTEKTKDEKKDAVTSRSLARCFKCNETGHYASNCPLSNVTKKCFHCHQPGHLARDCTTKLISHLSASKKGDCLLRDEYHKIVLIEGEPILAFFDLGSDCSTLKENIVKEHGWKIEKSDVKLLGFGGKQTNVLGKIEKVITVSNIDILIDIMIVDESAQNVSMIVGRNFMDRPNIEIVKRWGIFDIKEVDCREKNNDKEKELNEDTRLNERDLIIHIDTSDKDITSLIQLINNYRECFAKDFRELGKTNLVQMEIKLKEKKVIRYHPYKVAYGLKEVLRKNIKDLMELDIIQPSSSEYASPVLLVPKKNGEHRMCVDYRKLNAITQRETFPVPNIEETLNSLANKKIFTTLDLLSGYHEVSIEKDSQRLTAFVTPEGHFEFKRVPFGLTNSPAVFMKLMAKVIQPIGGNKTIVYMDDILIPTTTIKENLEVLAEFLTEIKKSGLTLNVKKCIFFKQNIDFLGHEISADGIKPGLNKIRAVKDYKRPENVREIRQLLSLTGYFRRFIRGFSYIAQPLNKLLRKDVEFKWSEEAEDAFNSLRQLLSQRPLLALYDERAKHEVHTDASSHGIAGILMQETGGDLRPVSYFSRATTSTESRYHSYELEALAVVESLERFKHYLLYRNFKIVTDCNSLRQTQEKKDLIPRIARWWLKISEFDFELVFRPANKLVHADALSRCPVEEGKEGEDVSNKMLVIGAIEEDWLAVLQKQDPRLMEIWNVLKGEIITHDDKDGIRGNYILEKGRIFKITPNGNRFTVPTGARWRVIKSAHDDMGHPGIERTLETLKKYVWFPNMKPVVTKYVNSCVDCLYNKRGTDESRYKIHLPERQPIPFHTVHLDHLGPYPKSKSGNNYVVGMVDTFTKYVILKPVRTTTSRGVIKLLEDVTQYVGMPTRIITDRGSAFTSKEFQRFCQENSIKHVLTAVKTPRANGQIERYFRTTKAEIAAVAHDVDGRDWDINIRSIQWALNSLKHSTTLVTPQQLIFTYQPRDILKNKLLLALHDTIEKEEEENVPLSEIREKILNRIREKQNTQAAKFNATHKCPVNYKEGDLVLIRHESASTGQPRKLQPRYKGPYLVKAVLPNDRYVITDTEELQVSRKPYESVQSAERMKPWCNLADLNMDEGWLEDADEEVVEAMQP